MLNAKIDSEVDRYKERVEKFSSSIDFSLFLYLMFKSKYFITLFFIISFSCAFLYLRYSQPIYESKSKLQVNDNNEANKILELNQLESNNNKIAEAIELLRSKKFIGRVVTRLEIEVSYFNEGTFKSNELYVNSPYKIKINLKNDELYNQKLYITFSSDLSSGDISYTLGGVVKTVKFFTNSVLRSADFDVTVYFNPAFEKTTLINTIKSNKFYFVVKNVDVVTSELQDKIDIKMLSDLAKTILVTVSDINPRKSKDIVNAIMDEYIDYDVERKSESSKKIIEFIDGQLSVVFEDLKGAERNLQSFKKDKNINDKDVVLNSNLMRYTNLEDQLLKVEMEEKILDEIQSNITKNKNIDVYIFIFCYV